MKNIIIYKYLPVKDALRVILNKTLKFSHPQDFNDPFDCYEELLKFEVTEEFLKEHLDKRILMLDESERESSTPELIDSLKKNTYTFDNKDTKSVFDAAIKTLWISCFSKTYKENLMWSHYANFHKGVCIGFNYNGLRKTFGFSPSEVKYKKNFNKKDYCKNEMDALEYLINTKSKIWKYEKEIRLRTFEETSSIDCNGIVSIHPDSVSEIILGCNCPINSDAIKNRLLKLNYRNVELIKLTKSKNSFILDEIRI